MQGSGAPAGRRTTRPSNRDRRFNLRLDAETAERWEVAAFLEGMTVSELVRAAVNERVNRAIAAYRPYLRRPGRRCGAHAPPPRAACHEDRINHYVKADGKHYPIVVIGMPAAGRIEVCDGHHRVMAARRRGRTVIRAVFVVEMGLVEYNAIRARAGA